MARLASSIMRSTRPRISAPRLLSTVGRGGGAAGFRFDFGDGRLQSRRRHRHAGQLFDLDALVRVFHDVVPGHRRQRAAGHAVGRGVVVVAEPDAADEIAGVAHEPGIAVSVGRAGLAGGGDAVEARAPAGAVFDDAVHHLDHVGGDVVRQHALRLRPVAVVAPDQLAVAGAHLEDSVRRDLHAEIGERAVGADVVDQLHGVGADRQRRRIGQRRGDAHVVRRLDDARAAELGVAVADHHRQAHGNGVDRMGERGDQRHRAAVAMAVIVRAPVADADRRIDHDRTRLHAVHRARSNRRRV